MKLQHRLLYIQLTFMTLLSVRAEASERFFVSGSYLLMKSQQDGISYGSRYSGTDTGSTSPVVVNLNDKELFFPFDFNSGFRIIAGWEVPCTNWGLKSSWDYLLSTSHAHQRSVTGVGPASLDTTGTNLSPAFGNSLNLPNVSLSDQSLEASWRANFNQVDIYLDRKFESFQRLGFNVLLGLRLTSLDQNIHSDYEISGTSTGITPLIQAASQLDDLKSQFRGIGVVTGFETHWFIWEGLNLYGFLKGALLYSNTKSTLQALENQALDGVSSTFVQSKSNKSQQLKGAVDLGIGLEYAFDLCGWSLCAHTAWEHHIWFNQNQFTSAYTSPQISTQSDKPWSGDFYYTGWSLGLDLIF